MNEVLNYKEENKSLIEGELNHNYQYYEFNKDKILEIISKNINDVNDKEWRTLIQMIFPQNLICSGLFQSFLIFDIEDGLRVDPPKYAFDDVCTKAYDFILLIKIYDFLINNNVSSFDSSWIDSINKLKGDNNDAK